MAGANGDPAQALSPLQKSYREVCKEIAIICNILAMAHLSTEDYKMSQELLKKAEIYCENVHPPVKAITYNNFACLFRKTNKLRNAL